MMKKTVFSIFTVLLTLIGFSQTNWVPQNSGTSKRLNDVQFINDSIGWVCGGGVMLHTTDGGENWIVQDDSIGAFNMHFVNQNTGYKTKYNRVFKTEDGGYSWEMVYEVTLINHYFADIFFLDSLTGWAVGGGGGDHGPPLHRSIRYTSNGGIDWTLQYLFFDPSSFATGGIFSSIFFTNPQTGYVLCSDSILMTTDCGANWFVHAGWSSSTYGIELFFISESNGWIAAHNSGLGKSSVVLHTEDAGLNWTTDTVMAAGLLLSSLFFIDENNGWIAGYEPWNGGGGYIFHTSDGGDSWSEDLEPDDTDKLYKIFFADSQQGWAVGNNGTILTCFSTVDINENVINTKLNIFPNPVSGKLYINITDATSKNVQISLHNSLGQVVFKTQRTTNSGLLHTNINTRDYPAGLYFLIIDQQNGITVEKLIISR